MKKVLQIFQRDLKRLLRSPAAALVMVGVCILPSLYAWFNIAANMDPYGNTKNVKVAIANCDTGGHTGSIDLNAGDTIVQNLKKNHQLGWTFVDEKKAKSGVRSGKYYAAIVIPEDFSESLLSILSGDLKQPQLDYYINEKKNAIAPKITATGASTIQQQINDTFSSVAADSIAKIVQKSAGTLTGKLDGTNSTLMQALTDTRKNLADYQNALKDFQTTVKDSGSLIDDTLKTLDSVNAVASSGSAALADSSDLLATSRTAIGTFSTEFSTSLSDGETLLNNVYTSAVLKLGTFETKATQVNTAIGDSISSASSLNKKNAEILEKLAALQQQIGSDSSLSGIVSEKIAELQAQNASLQELIDSLGNSNSSIGNALTTASNTRSSLETLTAQNRQSLQNYRSSLNQSLLP